MLERLLLGACLRGLSAAKPDPRWASIALDLYGDKINAHTREEEEWLSRADELDLEELVEDMVGRPPGATSSSTSASEPDEGTT